MRRLPLILALLIVGAALSACGGGYEATPEQAAAADVVEQAPVLEDYRGTPLAIAFFHPF